MLDNTNSNQSGFTLVEMIVAVTAGTLVIVLVLSISFYYFANILQVNAQTRLVTEAQIALNRVVEDVRTGSAVLLSNTITDINEPVGGWTTSNADLILILSTPALDSTNAFIFDSDTGNPYQNEFIYFTDSDNHLHKRILANPSAPDNIATTTCPETAATPACPADSLLTDNFDTMSFSFFDRDNVPTADPTAARSANITILMNDNVFSREIKAENNTRMSLRNPGV